MHYAASCWPRHGSRNLCSRLCGSCMVVLPGKAHAVSCQSHVHVRVRVRMECLLLFYPNIYIAGLHFNLRLALSSTNTFPPLLTTQRVPESRLPTRMERLRAHPPTILISSPHFVDCYIHTDLFHRLRYSALRHQKLWCCDSRVWSMVQFPCHPVLVGQWLERFLNLVWSFILVRTGERRWCACVLRRRCA